MSSERQIIIALLKIHREYMNLFETLDDTRYLQRANNCVEMIRMHFLSNEER